MSGSCRTTERSRSPFSHISAHFLRIGWYSSEGRWRDNKDRIWDLIASLSSACVAATRARSSAAILFPLSNSAARLAASSAWGRTSGTALWTSRTACLVGERVFDERRRDNRGINVCCLVERTLTGPGRLSDDGDVSKVSGGGGENGREGEEEEGVNEEEGLGNLSEEVDEVETTQIDDRDPLARGSTSAPIRLVSILGSGKGGNGRRGDFDAPCGTALKWWGGGT